MAKDFDNIEPNLYALVLLTVTAALCSLIYRQQDKHIEDTNESSEALRLVFIIWINKDRRELNKTLRNFIETHKSDQGIQLVLLTNPSDVSDLDSLPSNIMIGDIVRLKSFALSNGRIINPQHIIQTSIQYSQNTNTTVMLAVASDFMRLLMLSRPKEMISQLIESNSTMYHSILDQLDLGSDVLYTDCDVSIDLSQRFSGMFPVFTVPKTSDQYFFFRNDVMYSSASQREVFLNIITALLTSEKYAIFSQALTGLSDKSIGKDSKQVAESFRHQLVAQLPENVVQPHQTNIASETWSMALAGFHPAAVLGLQTTTNHDAPDSLIESMRVGRLVVFASRAIESDVVDANNLPRKDLAFTIKGKPHLLSNIAFEKLSHSLPSDMGKSWDGSGELSNMEKGITRRCPHPL